MLLSYYLAIGISLAIWAEFVAQTKAQQGHPAINTDSTWGWLLLLLVTLWPVALYWAWIEGGDRNA